MISGNLKGNIPLGKLPGAQAGTSGRADFRIECSGDACLAPTFKFGVHSMRTYVHRTAGRCDQALAHRAPGPARLGRADYWYTRLRSHTEQADISRASRVILGESSRGRSAGGIETAPAGLSWLSLTRRLRVTCSSRFQVYQ